MNNGGTFDPTIKRFRKPGAWYMPGVSDILGIFNHRMLAIEVKTEKGKPSPHQKQFLFTVASQGGIAMIARSIEEVEMNLEKWA